MARAERSEERGWGATVDAGWFVLIVVASGFVFFVQESLHVAWVPVETGGRVLLVLAIAYAVARGSRGVLGGALGASILAFSISGAIATGMALSQADAFQSFLFMYGTAMFVPFFLVARIRVPRSRALALYSVVVTAFAAIQALRQSLMLPDAYLTKFGIVWQEFVNGRVRVLGFFASPPRMAEMLVFIAVYLQYPLLTGRKGNPWRLAALAVVLFALYNTYSRSGYILWASSLAVELMLVFGARRRLTISQPVVRFFVLAGAVVGAFAVLLTHGMPADSALTDSTSLHERFFHWGSVLDRLSAQGPLQTLFGSGQSAHYSPASPNYFVLDNLFLAIVLYSGFIGLLCVLALALFSIQRALVVARESQQESRLFPIIAMMVCLIPEGMFLDNHNTLFIVEVAVLGMLCDTAVRSRSSGVRSKGNAESVPTPTPPSKSGNGENERTQNSNAQKPCVGAQI